MEYIIDMGIVNNSVTENISNTWIIENLVIDNAFTMEIINKSDVDVFNKRITYNSVINRERQKRIWYQKSEFSHLPPPRKCFFLAKKLESAIKFEGPHIKTNVPLEKPGFFTFSPL